MVRPQKARRVAYNPGISYFKPRGVPMFDLQEVCLTIDQREAIRLSDLLGMSHEEAGRAMGVSRATFGRIIQRARETVADALIHGKAINVEGGNYQLMDTVRRFCCANCDHEWEASIGTGRPSHCPVCHNSNVYRIRPKRDAGGDLSS